MKRYQVAHLFWITLVTGFVSMVAIIIFLVKWFGFIQSPDLTVSRLDRIKPGQTFVVSADRFLVGPNGYIRGIIFDGSIDEKIIITVPLEEKYIEVGIADLELQKKFKSYQDGRGDLFTITVQVREFPESDPGGVSWYDFFEGFDKNSLYLKYTFVEYSSKDFKIFFYVGVLFLVLSFLSFATIGGIHKVTVKPFEDSSEYRECYFGKVYHLEERLKREKENLEIYRKEQQESWKKWPIGVLLILAGSAVAFFILQLGGGLLGLVSAVILGGYLLLAGCQCIWKCFINSGSGLAHQVSVKFLLRSTSVKMEETSKLIGAIKHGMSMREETKEEAE